MQGLLLWSRDDSPDLFEPAGALGAGILPWINHGRKDEPTPLGVTQPYERAHPPIGTLSTAGANHLPEDQMCSTSPPINSHSFLSHGLQLML